MGLKGSQAKKAMGFQPEPDNYVARCYSVVHIGTQTSTGKYGTKTGEKLRISFELPTCLHVFNDKEGEQPASIHTREMNFIFGEKASFQVLLEKWFNKKLTDEAIEQLDIEKLVGKTAMILVQHNDRGYAEIAAITPLPKGVKCPAAVNKALYYDVTMGMDCDSFKRLPKFLQEKVAGCHEFRGGTEQSEEQEQNDNDNFLGGQEPAEKVASDAKDETDSDLPF